MPQLHVSTRKLRMPRKKALMRNLPDHIKDPLLHRDFLAFSVDAIFSANNDYFSLRILPDISSDFYPPFHTRTINVLPELLEEQFYSSIKRNNRPTYKGSFAPSVVQGGYYKVQTEILQNKKVFDPNTVLSAQDDFFEKARLKSPFDETNIAGDYLVEPDNISEELSITSPSESLNEIYLYGFNVGQGDALLLITSEKNAYIIDGNFYNAQKVDSFVNEVKATLMKHGIPPDRIKGLFVTHKHIDHMRGLKYLLNKDYFSIEYFFINLDYNHPTKAVFELLYAAKHHVKKWINVNHAISWQETETKICVRNPDAATCCSKNAPNINDSSIVLCVEFKDNLIFLTGDASYDILQNKLSCAHIPQQNERLLKVSHHGSDTGTDSVILNALDPTHAFISAGYSKRYNHPHQAVVNILRNQVSSGNLRISKMVANTTCIKADGNRIYII